MTYRELASLVANLEGRKHQATVGDVREILKLLRQVFGVRFSVMVRELPPMPKEEG